MPGDLCVVDVTVNRSTPKGPIMFAAQSIRPRQVNNHSVIGGLDRLIHAVKTVMKNVAAGTDQARHYDEVGTVLQTLPLSTLEYALSVQRLVNARMYSVHGEKGAARYELTMLARSVTKGLIAVYGQ
jgi:hypothetical protein